MSRIKKFRLGFSRGAAEDTLCEIYHRFGSNWFMARDVTKEISGFGSSGILGQLEFAGALESKQFRERGRTLKQYRLTPDAMYFCLMCSEKK